MMASRRRRNTRKNACCHRLDEQRGARERECVMCVLGRWQGEERERPELVERWLSYFWICVLRVWFA
jgi:hypothetical protein